MSDGVADLVRLAQKAAVELPVSVLPGLLGGLEAAKAAAWARLVSPAERQDGGEDRLLTMPEVAKRLGTTEHQAREMGRRGELPTVTVGDRFVRVRAGALADWIRRGENGRTIRREGGR